MRHDLHVYVGTESNRRLELFVHDAVNYMQQYCSNKAFKANPSFVKVCVRGVDSVKQLGWMSNTIKENFCKTVELKV